MTTTSKPVCRDVTVAMAVESVLGYLIRAAANLADGQDNGGNDPDELRELGAGLDVMSRRLTDAAGAMEARNGRMLVTDERQGILQCTVCGEIVAFGGYRDHGCPDAQWREPKRY
jgi:hypothetical protein